MNRENDLIEAFLEDCLTDEQVDKLNDWLRADPANVRKFVIANAREDQLRRVAISSAALRAATNQRACKMPAGRRRLRTRLSLGLGVTVAVAIAFVWLSMARNSSEFQATLVQVKGSVSFQEAGASRFEQLPIKSQVGEGTVIVEGEGARAEFVFADGSVFDLSADTEVQMSEREGKQLFLHRGTLFASVSPQPAGRPMRIQTPTAEAVVVGTSFVIDATEAETFLRVNSGEVQLRRLADSRTFGVSTNEQARVTPTATQSVPVEPVTSIPDEWHAASDSPRVSQWCGEWRSDVLAALPRTIPADNPNDLVRHFHAGVLSTFPGLVTLRKDSVIRLRYRIDRPLNVGLFVGTRTQSGSFAGNYQSWIKHKNTTADSDGWRTATVPVLSLVPIRPQEYSFQHDCVANTIFATTYEDDVGLEVAEFQVSFVGNDQ